MVGIEAPEGTTSVVSPAEGQPRFMSMVSAVSWVLKECFVKVGTATDFFV